MKLLKWLQPEPDIVSVVETETVYVVEPHMGQRQLDMIMKNVDKSKYRVGDSLESVAYRQGQLDLADFIRKHIITGGS